MFSLEIVNEFLEENYTFWSYNISNLDEKQKYALEFFGEENLVNICWIDWSLFGKNTSLNNLWSMFQSINVLDYLE